MPRDSSGTYTLPAGNPVISGTTITSNWANSTMPDVGNALTDSLSRTGQGGMLAPLPFVDGALLTPAITFNLEQTLGFYRQSNGVMMMSIGNRDQVRFEATNQLSVQRDYGGGLAWYAVIDTQAFNQLWNAKLAGYEIGGLHTIYLGDLDDIISNSVYQVAAADVVNGPAGMTSLAVIQTDVLAVDFLTQRMWSCSPNPQMEWRRSQFTTVFSPWELVINGAV